MNANTYSKRLLQLISWSHWFTFFNVAAAIALSTVFIFAEPIPPTLFARSYLLTTWFSHMAFLTFIGFMLIVFPLTLLFPYTRFIRGSASIIFTGGLFLLVLDGFIYSRLGYHLNGSSMSQILELIQHQIERDSLTFWSVSIVLLVVILTFELVISNYAWKHLKQLQKTYFARPIVAILVGSFVYSHLVHIYADASLDYDILRQDTLLPFSYPSTAKTLLTKYGLFDRDDYIARRNSPLTFSQPVPSYPLANGQCSLLEQKRIPKVFIILSDAVLTEQQVTNISQRAITSVRKFDHHIDNALADDAWFNFLYSLPSIYKTAVLQQGKAPMLHQLLIKNQLTSSYTRVATERSAETPSWVLKLFNRHVQYNDISSLILADSMQEYQAGMHIIHFTGDDPYQFELFVDALLLSQRQQQGSDIIWISSLGNKDRITSLSNKPAILLWPEQKSRAESRLTSQMDIMPTLVKRWLNCEMDHSRYSIDGDLFKLKTDRVVANTMTDGITVFNKDKSLFIDQHGNFQSYSRQLSSPIIENSDFPLMIDGVNFINRFAVNNKSEQ